MADSSNTDYSSESNSSIDESNSSVDLSVASNSENQNVEVSRSPKPIKKRRNHKKRGSFSYFIFKLLKQVYAELGITTKGIAIIDSFVFDFFERVSSEAGKLCKANKSKTITSRDIQTAVRFLLSGELLMNAINESQKALTTYSQRSQTKIKPLTKKPKK